MDHLSDNATGERLAPVTIYWGHRGIFLILTHKAMRQFLIKMTMISQLLSASALSASLFVNEPLTRRTLQKWHPYICPFEEIIPLVPEGSTVLDIGCGSGLLLGLLSSTGRVRKGVGVEVSTAALKSARNMVEGMDQRGAGAGLRFIQTASPNRWPSAQFDCVTMIDVTHHIARPDQEHFVREACRRVAPGGRFIYKDMARRPLWRAVANRMHDLVLARQWIHYLPIEVLEDIATEEGLTPELRSDTSRLWYGHELRVFSRPE